MNLSYCMSGMLTRRVLLEKYIKTSNHYLHIYTLPTVTDSTCTQQLDSGLSIAKQYDLKAIEQAEFYPDSNDECIIGDTLKTLLVSVSYKAIQHIFVEDITLFCTERKYLLDYILCFLILHDVQIFTKSGLVCVDYLDLRELNDRPFKYFYRLIYANWNHPIQ